MENNFITVYTSHGVYVHLNTNHIRSIQSNGHGSRIFMIGLEHPFIVNSNMDDILNKITEPKNKI
jgi:uncharacterized protein YlzI (FlbEa/FlbD family)